MYRNFFGAGLESGHHRLEPWGTGFPGHQTPVETLGAALLTLDHRDHVHQIPDRRTGLGKTSAPLFRELLHVNAFRVCIEIDRAAAGEPGQRERRALGEVSSQRRRRTDRREHLDAR